MTDPTPLGRRRLGRREMAMLGVLGAVALIAVGFLVLSGGDGGSPADDLGLPTARPTARDTRTPAARPSTPPPEVEVFSGRDPFEPPFAPSPTGSPAPGNGATPGPGSTGSAQGHRVSLVDIFEEGGSRKALIEVDGTEYTVGVGQVFADSFRLDALSADCADITFGDEGFELCTGEEILK